MAKHIGSYKGTKDDPVYDPDWVVGPVTVSGPSTRKAAEPEVEEAPPPVEKEAPEQP